MSAPLRLVEPGTSLVDELAASLRKRLPDPTPTADPSETDVVRYVHQLGAPVADRYVTYRLMYTLRQLDDPMTRRAAWADGRVALGAYETLHELGGAQ